MTKKKDAGHELTNASTGNVDWSVFLQEGVIVTLTIKRYRGTATVDFSELGLDSDDEKLQSFLGEYIQPGQKRLIPPEIEKSLKSIETCARNNLKEKSFDCSALASTGKFVPKTQYHEFKEKNEELQNRFYDIRNEFEKNYDNIVERVCKDYKVLAENLYRQSHPDAKRVSSKYVNAFVDKIREQIPPADVIVSSFEYRTILQQIPDYLLKAIKNKNNIDEKIMRIAATNQNGAEALQRERDITAEKLLATNEEEKRNEKTGRKSSNKANKRSKISNVDDNGIEIPKVIHITNSNEELDSDIRDSILTQSQSMADDFINDIKTKLRNEAFKGAMTVLTSIDKNGGKLLGRSSVRAHNLVDDLKKMNFYEDKKLDERIKELEDSLLINEENKTRDIEAVKLACENLQAWATGRPIKTRTDEQQKQETRKSVKINVQKATARRRTIKSRS